MEIILNGSAEQLPGAVTVAQLLLWKGLSDKRLAVEINEEIVPGSLHASVHLQPGDRLEIIQAIGGG